MHPKLNLLLTVVNRNFFKDVIRRVSTNTEAVSAQTEHVKSFDEIPGPRDLPIIGPLHHLLPGGAFYKLEGLALTRKLHQAYGPIVKMGSFLGNPPIVFIYDAESAAQILRGENWQPVRPGFKTLEYYRHKYRKNRKPNQITGLITDHEEPWKEFRSTVNPVLMQPKTIKLYTSSLDEVAQDTVARLKSLRDENNQLRTNINQEMNLWGLESIAVVALGTRLNCLDPNLPEDSPANQLIQNVHAFFEVASEIDFKPSLWQIYPTKSFKKAMKIYEQLETLPKHFIDQAARELKKNKNKSEDEKGILEKLLEINEEFAYIMAADMLFAGVDTTSNTLIATLYLLAKNPEKQTKLREEVLSDQDKKPFLKACLKESMRLLPVAGGNLRVTSKDYNILGYNVPKGIFAVSCHHDMTLMEDHFSRPDDFIPERWLLEKSDPLSYKNAHPFAFSPFGFGVRSCAGRRIAELELETLLTHMIQNFQVDWTGPPLRIKTAPLNFVVPPFHFVFNDV